MGSENFAEPQEAQFRYTELEGEYQATKGTAALLIDRGRTSEWLTES